VVGSGVNLVSLSVGAQVTNALLLPIMLGFLIPARAQGAAALPTEWSLCRAVRRDHWDDRRVSASFPVLWVCGAEHPRGTRLSNFAGPDSNFLELDNQVGRGNAHAVGRRNIDFRQPFLGNVRQLLRVLAIEVEVRPGLGVVPELGLVDRNLAQESAAGEFVERVLDCAEGRREAYRPRLLIEHLGREMPVAGAEERPAEVDPLARGPHPRRLKPASDQAVDPLLGSVALRLHSVRVSAQPRRYGPRITSFLIRLSLMGKRGGWRC
jgi:hypothetical protein